MAMSEKYMKGEYSKMQVLQSFNNNMTEDVYKRKEVNYQSVTNDTNEYYSEVVAAQILQKYNISDSSALKKYLFPENKMTVEKERTYDVIHKPENIEINNKSKRNEENIAKNSLKISLCSDDNYEVIDYQVPVNRVQYSKQGKIDLILRNNKENTLLLAELKDENSSETILRAVTEIKTYLTKIEVNNSSYKRIKESYKNSSVDLEKILPAVIFSNDKDKKLKEVSRGLIKVHNRPKHEFNEMVQGNMPYLYKLCKAWNIEFFELTIDKKGETDGQRDYNKDEYTLKHLTY